MATINDNTYIIAANTGDKRADFLIDNMLDSRLERYRQLHLVRGEQINYGNNHLQTTWKPVLTNAPLKAIRNNLHVGEHPAAGSITFVNPVLGTFDVDPVLDRGETFYVSYYFDYFPDFVLLGMLKQAMDIVNAYEPATTGTLDMAPHAWDGIIAEQAYVLCLEKLILDDTLWEPNLIFVNPDAVVSQLESALSGARERLVSTIPQMKRIPYVSPPTWAYYDAIRMGGGRVSFHGQSIGYGKSRGIRINRWFGR